MNLLDEWVPGCWCAAVLKLCDEHIDETTRGAIRFPEQWMHVLWRPMTRALPFWRPDSWGFNVIHPQGLLNREVGAEPLYLLRADECLWSVWLDVALACDRHEPWFTEALSRARQVQLAVERRLYVDWYGHRAQDFERFFGNLLEMPDAVTIANDSIRSALDRVGADLGQEVRTQTLNAGSKHEGRVTLLTDGSLRFLLADGFGVPVEHLTLAASAVSLLVFGLRQRTGWHVSSASVLLDLLPRCFVSWFDFRTWLLDQGLPVAWRVD